MKNRRFMTAKEATALVIVVMALAAWLFAPKGAGGWVVLTRGGEELGRYALDTAARVSVKGANGFSLTLVMEGGQAHVEDSTCPDLICQHHGPVSKEGETIICLPARVVIEVEGGERRGADAVSG